jgi:hypothetical protein
MSVSFEVRYLDFQQAVRRWAAVSGRTQGAVLRTSAKMVISNPRQGSGLLQITPPASAGKIGTAARRQGERAIARDLAKIFQPVTIKFIGPSPERHQAPGPIQRRHFALKRPGRPIRRDRSRAYYVDERRFIAMRKELLRRVGYLASGWVASARQLGVAVPAWIARHGAGRGTIRIQFAAPRYGMTMTCFAPANSPWQELQRRVPYALKYATNNLRRQIKYQMEQDARGVGLKVIG